MATIGTPIDHNDYNDAQSLLEDVLGIGENGYGLPLLQSTPVEQGQTLSARQWNDLIKDINYAYTHIANTTTSTGYIITGTTAVSADITNALNSTAIWLADSSRRYVCDPSNFLINNVTSNKTFYGDGNSIRTLTWGVGTSEITHRVVTSFQNRLSARYYFNEGCYLNFLPSYTVGTGLNDIDAEWSTFIDYLRAPELEYKYTREQFVNYTSTTTSWNSGTLTVSVTANKSSDEKSIEFTMKYKNNESATLIVSPTVGYWNILV